MLTGTYIYIYYTSGDAPAADGPQKDVPNIFTAASTPHPPLYPRTFVTHSYILCGCVEIIFGEPIHTQKPHMAGDVLIIYIYTPNVICIWR